MQPNQQQNPQQQPQPLQQASQPQNTGAPIDYLNQISGPQKVNTVNPLLLWGVIGGVLLIAIAAIFALVGSSNKGPDIASAAQRIQMLQTATESNQSRLSSSKLRTYNTALDTILRNSEREAMGLLSEGEAKSFKKTLKDSPIKPEFDKLAATLNDARLNNVLDRVYSREITYHINLLLRDLRIISKSKSSKSIRAFVDDTERNIDPILKQFTEFKDTQQ